MSELTTVPLQSPTSWENFRDTWSKAWYWLRLDWIKEQWGESYPLFWTLGPAWHWLDPFIGRPRSWDKETRHLAGLASALDLLNLNSNSKSSLALRWFKSKEPTGCSSRHMPSLYWPHFKAVAPLPHGPVGVGFFQSLMDQLNDSYFPGWKK